MDNGHQWKATLFECDVEFEGVRTCVQHWSCPKCGEKQVQPHGFQPHSGIKCEDKRELMKAVEAFKERQPKGWGNGKKARGDHHK